MYDTESEQFEEIVFSEFCATYLSALYAAWLANPAPMSVQARMLNKLTHKSVYIEFPRL